MTVGRENQEMISKTRTMSMETYPFVFGAEMTNKREAISRTLQVSRTNWPLQRRGRRADGATPSARLKERLIWAASAKPAACAASVSDTFPETMAAAARCSRNQER